MCFACDTYVSCIYIYTYNACCFLSSSSSQPSMDMAKFSVCALARRTLLNHHHLSHMVSKSAMLPPISYPICRTFPWLLCPPSSITISTETRRHISCSTSGKDSVSSHRISFKECDLHIYNTMTRQKERFQSIFEGKVGIYVCGVTPYDYSHIGHARVYVSFDVLFR